MSTDQNMAAEEFKKIVEASQEIELTVTGRTSGREIARDVGDVP